MKKLVRITLKKVRITGTVYHSTERPRRSLGNIKSDSAGGGMGGHLLVQFHSSIRNIFLTTLKLRLQTQMGNGDSETGARSSEIPTRAPDSRTGG